MPCVVFQKKHVEWDFLLYCQIFFPLGHPFLPLPLGLICRNEYSFIFSIMTDMAFSLVRTHFICSSTFTMYQLAVRYLKELNFGEPWAVWCQAHLWLAFRFQGHFCRLLSIGKLNSQEFCSEGWLFQTRVSPQLYKHISWLYTNEGWRYRYYTSVSNSYFISNFLWTL